MAAGESAAEDVARSYLGAFAAADPDVIAAHVAEDFVNEHTAALGEGCVGRVAYRERLPGFLGSMPALTYEVEHLVADGEQVMVTYRMRAMWQGSTPIDIRGAQRLVVRNGLITHRTDYWDAATFLLQADPAAAQALRPFGIT